MLAQARFEEALGLYQAMGDDQGVALARLNLAGLAWDRGEDHESHRLFGDYLALFWELGDKRGVVWSVEGLAIVAVAHGRLAEAARLFGAMEALRDKIGLPRDAVDRKGYMDAVAAARDQLGKGTFRAAWYAGQSVPVGHAVAEALAMAGALATTGKG
jgi:hypothetical protein